MSQRTAEIAGPPADSCPPRRDPTPRPGTSGPPTPSSCAPSPDMIVDARRLDGSPTLQADVVIVGGGVAGITMALELARNGIDTILLESGGHGPDPATRDLNRGTSTELPYRFADGSRSRFLGGSSNCWGGWCRPFEPWDFEPRAVGRPQRMAARRWPTWRPTTRRTHEYLDLGSYDYDLVARRRRRRASRTSSTCRCARDLVTTSISRFSPPTKLGVKYRDALASSRHVRTLLHANVVALDTTLDGRAVTAVRCRTLWGGCVPGRRDGSSCSPPAASRTPGCCWHRTTCGRPGSATSATSSGASSWTIHGSSRGPSASTGAWARQPALRRQVPRPQRSGDGAGAPMSPAP